MRLLGAVRLSELTDATTSPERQRDKITNYATLQNHAVVAIAEDLDVSGAVAPAARPELGPWLARLDEWDAIIVARFDRLSRSVRDFAAFTDWLETHEKTLICLEPSIDLTTPHGRSFAQMLAVFAEFEREMIRARVKDAYHQNRRSGKYTGGNAPFGYMPVKAEPKGWQLAPDPEVAPVVEQMVEMYLEGASLHGISRWLNLSGMPTSMNVTRMRSGKPVDPNAHWSPTQVRAILASSRLTGRILADGKELRDGDGMLIRLPPLIPDDTFAQVQSALVSRGYSRRSNGSKLLGVLYCAACNSPMYITSTKWKNGNGKRNYYLCQGRRLGTCGASHFRAEPLEHAVRELFLSLVGDQDIEDPVNIPAEDHSAELAEVDEAIANLESEYISGKLYAGPEGASRFSAMISRLESRRAKLAALPSSPARTEWRSTGQTFGQRWAGLDDQGRRMLMAQAGFKLRVVKKPDGGIVQAYALDKNLARRASLAAEGKPVDAVPENTEALARVLAPLKLDQQS